MVANCRMNRERRLASYNRELGLNVAELLSSRPGPVRWLDLCCGTANALFEAADSLPGEVEIVGVDLVDFFAGPSNPPRLRLITASVTAWEPQGAFDLITCVHGLHYVGDKLKVIAQAARWLTDDGVFVANFDVRSVRDPRGASAGQRLTQELRAAGLVYQTGTKRISCHGRREIHLPYAYLGADDQAGANYTGQPAVNSSYTR